MGEERGAGLKEHVEERDMRKLGKKRGIEERKERT